MDYVGLNILNDDLIPGCDIEWILLKMDLHNLLKTKDLGKVQNRDIVAVFEMSS